MELKIPEIPGYKIVKKLGRGGMADVYLGVQERLGREIAIKVMHPEMIRNPQLLSRFINEAKTASRLVHPNIITIHDVGQVENVCYIVMEYLQYSLVDKIRNSPDHHLNPQEALWILKNLALALAYAHKEGFIHRDIKPDNILFRKDNVPVLVDFGISRALDSDHHLTTTGMIIGTPHYMSPEQCKGEKIDGQSDIYALGIVLYEMLTGEIPYKADSAAGILVKHIQAPIPTFKGELTKYQSLLDRLLAKEKSERIRNAEELLKLLAFLNRESALETIEVDKPDLYVFSKNEPIDDHPTTVTPLPLEKKSHFLPWLLLVAFIFIGGLSGYYFLVYLPSQKGDSDHSTSKDPVKIEEKKIVTEFEPPLESQKNSTSRSDMSSPAESKKNGSIPGNQTQSTPELEKQNQYDELVKTIKDLIRQENLTSARQMIGEAKKLKNTDDLAKLESEIIQKEAALKKAEQDRILQKKDDDSFQQAVSRNAVYAYEKYLQTYPAGIHTEEAKKRLEKLKYSTQLEDKVKDDIAFETASKANTFLAYEEYIKQHPFGSNVPEARSRISYLKQKLIKETKIKIEITSIKFFEAGSNSLPLGQRKYTTRFPKDTTHYIYTEISYKNKLFHVKESTNRVMLHYTDMKGASQDPLTGVIAVEIDDSDGIYARGLGYTVPGKWQPGAYTVSVFIDDIEVGKARFEIF